MNPSCPIDIANEAHFQLCAAKEKLDWVVALACAIGLDLKHGHGKRSADLANLAMYLSDTGFVSMDDDIEAFRKIAESDLAPRSSTPADRGARLDGIDLAQRILAAREYASLSQADLAKLVGIEQGTVSQLEGGKTKRTGHLAEIARACGVDVNWLAFGSGDDQ